MFDTMKKSRFVPDIKSYTIQLEGWGQEQNLRFVPNIKVCIGYVLTLV